MSNYLQRLATSVRQPGGNIHPMLDPMFAAPRSEPAGPWSEENAIVPARPADLPPKESDAPTGELTVSEPPRLALPVADMAVGASSPSARASVSSLASPRPPAPSDPIRRAAPDQGEIVGPGEDYSAATEPTSRPYPVLITADFSAPDPHGAPPVRLPGPASSRPPDGRRRTASPPRADRAGHEPDEIQIHIGRIEVTAVPPATARPATPRRRSPSLQEYLRQRDGRSA